MTARPTSSRRSTAAPTTTSSKPFDVDELLARVRAALRRRPEVEDPTAVVRVGDVDDRPGALARDSTAARRCTSRRPSSASSTCSSGATAGSSPTRKGAARSPRHAEASSTRRRCACSSASSASKLGDDAADPKLIVTHFGLGYRWIAGENDDAPG